MEFIYFFANPFIANLTLIPSKCTYKSDIIKVIILHTDTEIIFLFNSLNIDHMDTYSKYCIVFNLNLILFGWWMPSLLIVHTTQKLDMLVLLRTVYSFSGLYTAYGIRLKLHAKHLSRKS